MQCNGILDEVNLITCWVKKKRTKTEQWLQRNWSILISSRDIPLLLYPVISSCGDLVSRLIQKCLQFLLLKVNDVTSLNLIRTIQGLKEKVS